MAPRRNTFATVLSCAALLLTLLGPAPTLAEEGKNLRKLFEVADDLQIHLAVTGESSVSLVVMWKSTKLTNADNARVQITADGKSFSVKPQFTDSWWNSIYRTHKAEIPNLVPGKVYSYQIFLNDDKGSAIKSFRAPYPELKGTNAKANDPWGFLVLGDIGTNDKAKRNLELMGKENLDYYELMMDVGDLAYAFGIDVVWNNYMRMIEPVASKIPWMTCPGNHELLALDSGLEFGGPMRARFYMPTRQSKSNNAHWYSFNHRIVHFTTISTDDDYFPGTEQYTWLEADLAAANTAEARAARPWLIVAMHKPMYGTFDRGGRGPDAGRGEPGSLVKNLEPLFVKYKVDLVFTGHQHFFERTFPVRDDGKTIEASYANPSSPVHFIVGMGGYLQIPDNMQVEKYSAYREQTYGYGRVSFLNASALQLEYVEQQTAKVHDSVIITKKIS